MGVLIFDDFFGTLRIHDKNLRIVTKRDWKYAEERSMDEILAELRLTSAFSSGTFSIPNSFKSQPLAIQQQTELARIKRLLSACCSGKDSLLLSDKEMEMKARLMGAWINLNHGWDGMEWCTLVSLTNWQIQALEHILNTLGTELERGNANSEML